ncbi:MAG: PaaI family thioesterase [Afipia sp.]|nr:PaaI family thioesterase [Afipia sp.]
MSLLNPPELAERITSGQGYTRAAGFRVVHVEAGKVELALAKKDELLQFGGHFHGGVIAAMVDQAAGIAVTSMLPKGKIGVTVELKVNFLAPAGGEEILARAEALQVGGTIGVAKIEVFSKTQNTETRCAFGTATMRAVDLPKSFA